MCVCTPRQLKKAEQPAAAQAELGSEFNERVYLQLCIEGFEGEDSCCLFL